MRILIIEDEQLASRRLHGLIKPYFPYSEIVDNLDSISLSVDYLQANPAPDLIFCDIQLGDGISFEIFQKVELSTPIIFTTAYDKYAIKAFEVNAIDYLLKPIDPKDLQKSIEKFKSKKITPELNLEVLKTLISPTPSIFKKRFLVRYGEKIQSIPTDQITFFFSEERVTFLQTDEGKRFVIDGNLEKTESQLDPDLFFRLNRKYLITSKAIDEIFSYSNSRLKVKLLNCSDNDILVSREKVPDFKLWLDR